MEYDDLYQTLHARSQLVHDAIKEVAHDAACRSHWSTHHARLEAQLRQISQTVTEIAQSLKDGTQ